MDRYPPLQAYLHPEPQALPMRQSWGPRYNPSSNKMDAPDLKGVGFNGPMLVGKGNDIASEYSRDDMINGKLRGYPTIYQGMPAAQLGAAMQAIRMNTRTGPQLGPVQLPNVPIPQAIDDAAYAAAKSRVNAGRSPFWEQGRDPYPAWSPDQFWEAPYGMK